MRNVTPSKRVQTWEFGTCSTLRLQTQPPPPQTGGPSALLNWTRMPLWPLLFWTQALYGAGLVSVIVFYTGPVDVARETRRDTGVTTGPSITLWPLNHNMNGLTALPFCSYPFSTSSSLSLPPWSAGVSIQSAQPQVFSKRGDSRCLSQIRVKTWNLKFYLLEWITAPEHIFFWC